MDENGIHNVAEPAERAALKMAREWIAHGHPVYHPYMIQHATAQFLVTDIPGVVGAGIGGSPDEPQIGIWVHETFDPADEPKVRALYPGLSVSFTTTSGFVLQ